jgi:hypothetical protein
MWYKTSNRGGFGSRGCGLSIESSIARLTSMRVVRVLQAASSWKKLIGETIGKVVWEQDPFKNLRVILVEN